MQGRIQVLETKTTETATQEVFGETANREDSRSIFATTEEEDHTKVRVFYAIKKAFWKK